MLSSEAASVIAAHRHDAVVVATMTTIFTFAQEHPNPLNIRCAPLMGGASSIGLGVALARPDRKVLVLDGDGSLLMQLGSLATISEAAPPNLVHFVFDNRVLYEGGGRVGVANAKGVDFVGLALAAGYPQAMSFKSAADLEERLPQVLSTPGPTLVRLQIEVPETPRWSNENPHGELPDWWFTMMGEDARAAAHELRN
jgi:phosphonopyruvate decarboxylase